MCVRKGSESRSLRNRPVSAINRNRAGRDLAVVNSLGRLTSRPPVLCRNFCLASWCAVQCSIKCCTDSGPCKHAGHSGESIFLIRCKCLARGAWPVRSWVRMLVSFLGSCVVSLRNLLDGAVGSVIFIRSNRGDFCHSFCPCTLSLSLKVWMCTDLLCGIRFWKYFGSRLLVLLPSVMAFPSSQYWEWGTYNGLRNSVGTTAIVAAIADTWLIWFEL